MDSIPLEMDDIFDEHEDADDFNPARLPDLEDELEPMRNFQNEDNGDNDQQDDPELLAKLKSMKGAAKNSVKRSYPKLDANRLTGERGIPILPKVFQNVSLKGKNHEAEDLKVIMRHLEHWGHRLFPKMPFAEILERVERLGSKKDVQNCVKRIRLDMPVLASEVAEEEEEEDQVQRGRQSGTEENENVCIRRPNTSLEDSIDEEELEDLLRDQERPINTAISESNKDSMPEPPVSTSPIHPVTTSLTNIDNSVNDDIKARIERNRKLALERRAARAAKTSEIGTRQVCGSALDESVSQGGPVPETLEETGRKRLVNSDGNLDYAAKELRSCQQSIDIENPTSAPDSNRSNKINSSCESELDSQSMFQESLEKTAHANTQIDQAEKADGNVNVDKISLKEASHIDNESKMFFTEDSDSEKLHIAVDEYE